MSRSIESQLNETYRDALVEYFLNAVVPNSPLMRELDLDTRLKTANDLYEFFLLDNQVANIVQTSPVASAITSLQQYINGALLGMEPGYDLLRPDEARFVEWRDRSSQYPIWAANMQLALYPEIYISPDLRLKKSRYFAQLESDINQNKIHIDTTQEAVKSYLASFEEVANLTILNGYIDSGRFAEGKYYFIGKSRAEQAYYWRMVDMNERAYKQGTEGPKYDHPTPGAWSDWKKAEIGVNANTLERTIRPTFFNNRLFITWVDLIHVMEEVEVTLPDGRVGQDPDGSFPVKPPDAATPVMRKTPNVRLIFNISYKKYDDSWSAPQIYMDVTHANVFTRAGKTVNLEQDLNSIAIFDISASPESLFIGMYAGEALVSDDTDGTTSKYAFLETGFLDKNFNYTKAFPAAGYIDTNYAPGSAEPDELRIRKTCWAFALKNKKNFQFTWSVYASFKTIETTLPQTQSPYWNFQDKQSKISHMTHSLEPKINQERSTITLYTAITENFINTPTTTLIITFTWYSYIWKLTLKPGNQSGSFYTLQAGSLLELSQPPDFSYRTFVNFGMSNTDIQNFLLTSNFIAYRVDFSNQQNQLELTGGLVKKTFIDYLSTISEPIKADGILYRSEDGAQWDGDSCEASIDNPSSNRPVVFNQEFKHPANMNTHDSDSQTLIHYTGNSDSLIKPSTRSIIIEFDKSTLRPKLNATFIENSKIFFITHGVGMDDKDTGANLGNAYVSTKIELEWEAEGTAAPFSPKISKRSDSVLGIAEYIDFSDSSIKFSDGSTTDVRNPIRMNTLFARELINKANIALEALLSWDTQHLPEPPIGDETEPSVMDFKGANGLYFWELFLHLSFMVSHRLNLEKQFNEAEFWLGFIFDPGRKANDSTGAPAYWNVRPLVELPDPDYFMRAPIDPDGIAASDPIRYQKAVYFQYIKNLIDRGDTAYRQLTPDSLGEAKLWYVRILDLLGPRPDMVLVSKWLPQTLQEVAGSTSAGLREFEAQLQEQEQQVRAGSLTVKNHLPLRLSTFASDPTLNEEDNAFFIAPMNAELVKYWDMLESRLYNLRHNLTLDGKPLSLPLFASPLDPRALLAAYANGATGGGAGSLLAQETPHYRYSVIFARASMAVDTLIQFGATLLSIVERKEQGQLQELQQQQVWDFAQFAIDLQLEAQKVEIEARKALEASKAIADARAAFYGGLADENVSFAERLAGVLHMKARISSGIAYTASAAAAALKPLPNHSGFHAGATGGMAVGAAAGGAAGGYRLEGTPEIAAMIAHGVTAVEDLTADAFEREEMWRRRLQDWENARDQARLESEQITAQLTVHDAQTKVTALQLRQAEVARKQAEEVYAFLNKRFTNSQLYQWLNGQFSMFYYQAYDATFSLCLAAQACWQYEIADYSASFIQPAAWKDAYRGLTAGESLKLNLLRMDAAYLTRNERRLEIVKTVSVKQLPPSSTEDPSLNVDWATTATRLKDEGVAEFEITKAMLDDDYPGHYLRRIKRISVSLPVTVGPYQDIRATLTQTYNAVQMGKAADAPLKENMRASQQIAVSTGVDDDGLFMFNFDDERYLPFEGTGAISRWNLTFPNHLAQQDMIDSITDIIVHVRYTAKNS